MKNLVKTLGVVGMTAVMGSAWAQCPSYLSADHMYDCIVVEGAGSEYKVPEQYAEKQQHEHKAAVKGQRTDQQAQAESTKHVGM